MALNLPQSNSVNVGNQAVAQAAIDGLISSSVELSVIMINLSLIENLFNFEVTKNIAEDTRESFDKQAMQTALRGLGGLLNGGLTLGGAAFATVKQWQAESVLKGDRAEIDTMNKYLEEAKQVQGPDSRVLSNRDRIGPMTEEEARGEAIQNRMEELTKTNDYKKLDLDESIEIYGPDKTDRLVIQKSSKEQANNLVTHLEKTIEKKQGYVTDQLRAASQKGETANLIGRSLGMIANGVTDGVGAQYQQEVGKYEASKAIGQSTQAMAQAAQNDLTSQANEALRTAIQTAQVLVNIAQGDVLTGS
ncbi:MAG: hypothetical protein KDK56_06985 [Simkania sp.]|nr:hypothetical protein [Simkania sp.]MCP5489589.1 hypothetical protein [Chlamydiales bacterium]